MKREHAVLGGALPPPAAFAGKHLKKRAFTGAAWLTFCSFGFFCFGFVFFLHFGFAAFINVNKCLERNRITMLTSTR